LLQPLDSSNPFNISLQKFPNFWVIFTSLALHFRSICIWWMLQVYHPFCYMEMRDAIVLYGVENGGWTCFVYYKAVAPTSARWWMDDKWFQFASLTMVVHLVAFLNYQFTNNPQASY
jgi:hypothetical protein